MCDVTLSSRENDESRVTRKLRGVRHSGDRKRSRTSPNPISCPIRHRDNYHPHLILGCPVVMFFNYVSIFNVAAAHPYLVNCCNFSCRAEMQTSHPGIKGQIELPQAGGGRERERDLHLFLYSFRLHLQFEPQQGDFQHAKQLSRKMSGMVIYPLYVRYFIFVCTVTPENIYDIKYGLRGVKSTATIMFKL